MSKENITEFTDKEHFIEYLIKNKCFMVYNNGYQFYVSIVSGKYVEEKIRIRSLIRDEIRLIKDIFEQGMYVKHKD